jgi:Copper type II ascorbate-dependent monooxygenase, C-terminal domain
MTKRVALAFALLIPVALGCASVTETGPTGGTSTGTGAGSGGASSGAGAGSGGAPEGSFSVSFGPVTVKPGAENTQCIIVRLKNPDALHVGKIHNQLSQGSHHVIVYRTNDTVEQPTPFNCQPFTDTLKPEKGSPLMITQKKDDLLTLPQGVAFSLQPNQMIRLEMHYINATEGDLQVHETTTFIPIADKDFKDEADFLFIGDPDISVPAHASQTLGPVYMAMPSNVKNAKFFGITGHTHQYGTNVKVAISDSKGGKDTSVYDVPNWKWSEPATVYADPPFEVPAGGGFHFSCDWDNTSNNTVSFGESANNEMCFFWAYYYPSQGAYVCVHTDMFAGGFDLCCPGNPLCAKVFP